MTRLGQFVAGLTGRATDSPDSPRQPDRPAHPAAAHASQSGAPAAPQAPAADDLRRRLSPIQYRVTQEAGTEAPFSGTYWDHHGDGVYRCVVCEAPLFDSGEKFESGTGWPSFWDVVDRGRVSTHTDRAFGMTRTEVTCANCGAHLGHVFPDGPRPTGLRYCINSAALDFAERDAETTPG